MIIFIRTDCPISNCYAPEIRRVKEVFGPRKVHFWLVYPENIDIGGPSMLRAAAKNFRHVIPVVDPRDYSLVLGKLDEGMDLATRLYLAVKAFRASARYEATIASYMTLLEARGDELVVNELEPSFPGTLSVAFEKVQDLRYGENPHQSINRAS